MVLLFLFIIFPCSCLNQCTYCKTKHARGDLGSYPPEEIVARAKQAFEGKLVQVMLNFPFYCSYIVFWFAPFLEKKGWLSVRGWGSKLKGVDSSSVWTIHVHVPNCVVLLFKKRTVLLQVTFSI